LTEAGCSIKPRRYSAFAGVLSPHTPRLCCVRTPSARAHVQPQDFFRSDRSKPAPGCSKADFTLQSRAYCRYGTATLYYSTRRPTVIIKASRRRRSAYVCVSYGSWIAVSVVIILGGHHGFIYMVLEVFLFVSRRAIAANSKRSTQPTVCTIAH